MEVRNSNILDKVLIISDTNLLNGTHGYAENLYTVYGTKKQYIISRKVKYYLSDLVQQENTPNIVSYWGRYNYIDGYYRTFKA